MSGKIDPDYDCYITVEEYHGVYYAFAPDNDLDYYFSSKDDAVRYINYNWMGEIEETPYTTD